MILRQVYIVFLGILLALFVGVGIAAFYSQPQPPKTQPVYPYQTPVNPGSPEEKVLQERDKANQKLYETYTQKTEEYNRNVSIISLISSIVFLTVSLVVLTKVVILTDGFLLGGLFTLIYSIFRGFGSDDSKYRFIVVTVSLIIALFIGFIKFIKTPGKK